MGAKRGGTITTEEAVKRGLLGSKPADIYARLRADRDPYAETYAKKVGLKEAAPLPRTGAGRPPQRTGTAARKGGLKFGLSIPLPRGTTATSREEAAGGGPSAEELAAAFLAAQGGGGGGISRADQIALSREEARLAAEENARQRAFQSEQDRIQREFQAAQERQRQEQERRAQEANLQAQRQQTYVELLGRDPARAILFALGYGPEHDVFSTQAQKLGITLKPLAGAAESEKTTELALAKLLGGRVDIGARGITGLGPAVGAARQFAQGGADVQKLLTSAFGVGSTAPGEQPGISPDRLVELLAQVTPTGGLQ